MAGSRKIGVLVRHSLPSRGVDSARKCIGLPHRTGETPERLGCRAQPNPTAQTIARRGGIPAQQSQRPNGRGARCATDLILLTFW